MAQSFSLLLHFCLKIYCQGLHWSFAIHTIFVGVFPCLFLLFNFVLVQYFNVFFLRSFRTVSLLLLRVKAQHLLALLLPSFKSRMFASCQPSIGISKLSPTDHLQEQKTALSMCTFTVLSLNCRGFWTTRNTPYVLQQGLGLKPGASCGKTVYFLISTKIVIEFPSFHQ